MHLGTQLIAPDGYMMLRKDIRYHFLANQAPQERALLAYFSQGPQAVHVLAMNRALFEDALLRHLIVVAPEQHPLPPDFSPLPSPTAWAVRAAARREALLRPHLQDLSLILASRNPERELNRRARACGSRQNETRFRLWYFRYLLYGNDIAVLYPPCSNVGRWNRTDPKYVKKPGRPHKYAGRHFGYRVDSEMHAKILNGYHRYKGLGVAMNKIYHKSLDKIFNCRVRHENGVSHLYSPTGDPFPTYGQFRYHVMKAVGKELISRAKYGDARTRRTASVSKGKFSAAVTNLMERVEADAYYTKDRPRGIEDNSTRDPLAVVCANDYASGLITAIGASPGKESALAYRAMCFCMAIDKVTFCRLFGIEIAPDDWPGAGLPPNFITDRGPGATDRLIDDLEKRFPLSGLAPSYSGQSKANVESSHPRDVRLEGQPSYIQSDLNTIQMMRREIERVIKHNKSAYPRTRVPQDLWVHKRMPCPNEIWQLLDSRARNDAQSLTFDEAVRTFLKPVAFKIRSDGLYLNHVRYDSKALRETGVLHLVAKGQSTTVDGYVLPLAVRTAWVEFEHQIIEVAAQYPHRVDEELLYFSLEDLEESNGLRRETLSIYRQHQHAVAVDSRQRIHEMLGQEGDAGTRRTGRAKTNATLARPETDVLKHRGSGR